jgi:hypothetical protein
LDGEEKYPFITIHDKSPVACIQMLIQLPARIKITVRYVLSVKMDLCSRFRNCLFDVLEQTKRNSSFEMLKTLTPCRKESIFVAVSLGVFG